MKYDSLVYGKNQLERIVSIEPTDEGTEVFFEDEKGIVYSNVLENEYWILANKPLDHLFHPMKGNLHYKFIKTYNLIKVPRGILTRPEKAQNKCQN